MNRKSKGKGCCKLSKVLLFPVALIMLIVLALNSYAFDCNVSSSPTTLNRGTLINISVSGGSAVPTDITNFYAEIYGSSASTANSTLVLLANLSNETNPTGVNWTLPTDATSFVLEDNNDYVIRAIVWNGTVNTQVNAVVNKTPCTNVTSITIDRTSPTIPTAIAPTGTLTNSTTQTISATVNAANTTGCTLTFVGNNPGGTRYAMTHSGNTCTQAFTNLPQAVFIYTITASDGTNTSLTAEQQFRIDVRTTTAKKAYIISGGQLPVQSSATAQERAKGQQGASALDKAIAKAPPEAQAGLTKAKEAVTAQYKGFEAVKTWTSTGVGCVAGFFIIPGIGVIPGCIVGHLVGAII